MLGSTRAPGASFVSIPAEESRCTPVWGMAYIYYWEGKIPNKLIM